jgi:quercetin dioxygenase-like cupin family protein
MRFKTATLLTISAVVLGSLSVGSVAFATDASDPPPGPTHGSVVVFGQLDVKTKAKNDGIELRTRDDTNVAVFELTYPVGSFSGWHSHPGIVIATVKSGSVKRQVGCKVKTFAAGDSFTEVEPHFVSNVYTDPEQPGAVPAVLEITQLYPGDPAAVRRFDAPAPACPHGVSEEK